MVKARDRDLELKLRFRRILFQQGYWCPIEVELSQYEALDTSVKRVSLTDLDVLGIKYDLLFTPFRVVGDCKSGKNVSEVSRIFWLKGISSFFGTDQAYFIHSTIRTHTRGIAPKLGLRVLDEVALLTLEKNLEVDKLHLPLADVSIHQAIVDLWGVKVGKGQKLTEQQLQFKEVYAYLAYSYWYIEQYRNLLNVISHFTRIAPLLDSQDPTHVLLAYAGLARFVHSLLETASFVFAQGGTNVPRDTRHYIFGGPLALKEKETFFELLRKLTNSNEKLDPPYLPDVIELLGRMIQNPVGACDVLRHIDAVYLWMENLKNDSFPPLDGGAHNTAAIVLMRDAAQTFARITGIKEAIYAVITSL
jgi:hypothetical protein